MPTCMRELNITYGESIVKYILHVSTVRTYYTYVLMYFHTIRERERSRESLVSKLKSRLMICDIRYVSILHVSNITEIKTR